MNIGRETTKIPNEVLHGKELTPLEKLILISVITHKHPVMTGCYLWFTVLEQDIKTIKLDGVIKSLEKKEWIIVKTYCNPEGHSHYAISINWFKIYQPDRLGNFPGDF
jgi:hypothetical protein